MGLVTLVEGKYYLQGILSGGFEQGFSVATNISKHTDWLKEAVEKVMGIMQCKNMFICGNRACIDLSRKCDGYDDCGDGSDESYIECRAQQSTSSVDKSGCVIPNLLDCVFDCIDDDCTLEGGDTVGFGKSVHLSCGLGTTVPESNPLGDYACLSSGKWSPEEPKCIRQCSSLVKPHVNVTCEYNYKVVECKDYMKQGTEASYSCDTFYTLPVASLATRKTKCLPGGRWRNELPECIPDCGYVNPHASTSLLTVAHGVETKDILAYPWHVAVHTRNSSLIWEQSCGGTIISPHLVLTAAHCLYMPNIFKRRNRKDFLVTAGKYKRNYYDTETTQQDRTVKSMVIPPAYGGFDKRHAEDIAILELDEPFKLSSYVLPICLKFDRSFDFATTTATIVGWGDTEKGFNHPSPVLLKAEIPLVTLEDCKIIAENEKSKDRFENYMTYDKFCGRFNNGSGPQKGDSGGGVIVQEGPKWYIVGIMSLKNYINTIAAFTNVFSHTSFITTTIKKLTPRS